MKTAISIPNSLFTEAEKLAKRLGMNRSQLYSRAVENFVENNRSRNITKLLNDVYKKEESKVDKVLYKMQIESMDNDEW
ncbi:hypothetical protein MYX76_01880 [Desulfobacterota bacterium AH_259_B03_O07]|nr:hypothetical protein [Desulfobacterota bacterium AH_259_B03_O07]